MSLAPHTRLGPYEIEALLGSGGMGHVYRARDTRLGRAVAIKVLPEAVSKDPERRERFDREARAIASLSHPHICALFDVGTHGDLRYLVMEYLEGETLADRLARGALPLGEALRFGAQIAGAVASAHARGIVHRDLKPANVSLTPNGVKVLDFGLAKFLEPAAPPSSPEDSPTVLSTGRHVILGTAAYMSPEQARGGPLDRRSDVWSFGVVLFEMLSGRRLFTGESVTDVLSAVLREPVAWAALPPNTPQPVQDLLARMLERDAERRLDDLGAAAGALEAGLLSDTSARAAAAAHPAEERKSVVVLPFTNLSSDPDNEYFSDGLTEEVIADLSRVGALRVISRTTAMRLKGTDKDLREVARELDVRYALEGSVRKAGNNLRITAQLIDTDTDAPLWSDKYGGTLDDVFLIQEQVSRAIVDSLRVKLTEDEHRQLAGPPRNPYAYDTFLRARRDIWSFRREGLDRAREELEHALRVVGDDVLLYRGLGLVNWQYVNAGISSDRRYIEQAEVYARKLLELDPGGSYGPALLGYTAIQRGDVTQWVRQLARAVEADPNDPDHLVWLAMGWTICGFPQRAKPLYDKLLTIDPFFDLVHFGLGFVEYVEGRYDRAIEPYEKALALAPEHPGWPMLLAQVLASAGAVERAVATIDQGLAPDRHPLARLGHVFKHALRGDAAAADELTTTEMTDIVWLDLQYAQIMAQAQSLLDRTDEGLRWLERAVERGFTHYPFLSERDPLLANLRADPRFSELMDRLRPRWERFEADVGAARS